MKLGLVFLVAVLAFGSLGATCEQKRDVACSLAEAGCAAFRVPTGASGSSGVVVMSAAEVHECAATVGMRRAAASASGSAK